MNKSEDSKDKQLLKSINRNKPTWRDKILCWWVGHDAVYAINKNYWICRRCHVDGAILVPNHNPQENNFL